jgi:hypothetical protein
MSGLVLAAKRYFEEAFVFITGNKRSELRKLNS